MTIHTLRARQPRQPSLPSLLDRLIDSGEGPDTGHDLEQIKRGIRRDLEWLLNSRIAQADVIDRYPELRRSLVNYGLPDFSTVLLGSDEHRELFRVTVQTAIERNEPRLQRIHVELSPLGRDHERTLYLKITALLLVKPEPVPLLLDSRIRAIDKAVQLRELAHG